MTGITSTLLDDQSSLGSDPPESDSDAQVNDELDQQSRLPVKRRSELHGDTMLNHKRMKRSTAFNTEGVSGNARIVNVGRDHITHLADEREATDRATMYNWLSSLDVSQNYNAARRRHQPGTGFWFITGKQFIDWKEHPATILCIYGDPGSGKTILCSSVVEDVKDMCKSQALSAYAYFFFDSRNADKGLLLHENLLRSLLSQISDRRDGIPDVVKEMYRAHRDGREQPSLKSVHETLRQLIDEFHDVYIIIDSLDECGDRTELLQWIKTVAEWNSTKVHLLLTSRLEPAITDKLDALTRICPVRLQGSTLEDDIAVYLDERLSLVNRWGNIMRALIKTTLINRADGMFRWVALQIDDLQCCLTAGEVKEQLKRLPRDLEETYERILSRSRRRRDLSQMLHWLAFSQRALRLDEIAEVVSVDLDGKDGPRYDSDLKYEDSKTALEVCSGLVTEVDGTVKLAHFSVKEYLLSENIRAGAAVFFGISASISHAVIARTCLAYLLIFNELDSIQAPLDTASRFPLHIYAAEHAAFHFQSVGNEVCPSLEKLLLNMFASTRSPALVNWIRISDPHWHPWERVDLSLGQQICQVARPLYYAALFGLKQVVERLLKDGTDPNQFGGTLGTALKVASYANHSGVVQLLIKHGANVNTQTRGDHIFLRPYTENALHAAVSQGHAETVAVLIQLGADVNLQSESYGTPLIDAAANGFTEIARLLLAGGADIHLHRTQINHHHTALHAAVQSSNIETIKLLFKWGANANAQKGDFGPALQQAVSWTSGGNVEIVQLLLENGADVNLLGGEDRAVLEEAASWGENVDVLALLLEWGADINLQGAYGTALQAAAQNGHLENTKLLLEHGADVALPGGYSVLPSAAFGGSTEVIQSILEKGADINLQGGIFGTALQAAAWQGNVAAVGLLLEWGANVNLLGDHGSVLRSAAAQGKVEVVKLLLEFGANVNLLGDHPSALQGAAVRGDLEVINLLLKSGANVNLLGYYGSALHGAAEGGKVEVVRLLLERGANVNLQGMVYGTTPLHCASRSGHTEAAKLLLEWGARVNVRARCGTALHEARNAHCDCNEVEQLLLAYGAVDRRSLEMRETRYKIVKIPRKDRGEQSWHGWKYTIRVRASRICVQNPK